MGRSRSGFTIVELLIVIVVIAILATITIIAFRGVQARSRDSVRYTDAKAIVKALELYKADKGTYPPMTASTTAASTCAGHTNGYSYSDATDTTWLRSLINGGYLNNPPIPPSNGCTSYYRYLYVSPGTAYNCSSRTSAYYVFEVNGVESMSTPSDAQDPAGGGNWTPCPTAINAGWGGGNNAWVFTKDDI